MTGSVETGRWLVLTASMGSGHDQVAAQIAGRIRRRGGDALVVDLLHVFPAGIGAGLRAGYAGMLRRAPWLYDGIFRTFFLDRRRYNPGVFPLDVVAARQLRPLLDRYRPDAVVSTFHLAAQVTGRMRCRGQLDVPSVVMITEPVTHRQWLHRGTDLFLCPYPWVARQARQRTGTVALAPGPLVDERFRRHPDPAAGRATLQLADGEQAVLVSAGSWGVGGAAGTARSLCALPRVRPVVLCGRNEQLRRRIGRLPRCLALGWRDDIADLFAAAAVLVDQSGGSACAEAFAVGLPVVLHQPLPGHGRLGARALVDHGLATLAEDPDALVEQVGRLLDGGPLRDGQVATAARAFVSDPVQALLDWRAARRNRAHPDSTGSRASISEERVSSTVPRIPTVAPTRVGTSHMPPRSCSPKTSTP
jgi:UDP-N-acetylglucosamine:LPS N-acetylglucosamine transferase